jgi:cobalamin biosynthesis protein CobD/CbiB
MKKFSIELKWGFLFFLSGLAWMVLEKSLGWHDRLIEQHATYTLLYAPLAIFIYVIALWEKKKKTYRGRMTFLQGFLSGLVITLVVVLLTPLSQYISHSLISPNYFANIIQLTVTAGEMTLQEAEAHFNLMNYTTMSVFFAAGMGLLTTVVVMIFMKSIPQKDPSE